jgi:phospholipid transport system substrate-binding protein
VTCRTALHRPQTPAALSDPAAVLPFIAPPRRRTARVLLRALAVLGLALAGSAVARADAAQDPAQSVVEAALQDTVRVFAEPQLSRAETAARLRALLDHYVDLPRVGRDSLGAHWRRASADQQAAFLGLFESFLCAGYSGSVAKLGGVRFGPTSVVERGNGFTVVRAELLDPDGPGLPVLFMVGRSDDGDYRILDVVAAAISFSKLLSADFGGVLRANGGQFDALIHAIERKLATTVSP